MKILLSLAVAASAAFALPTPAAARDGCGPRFHRGAYGRCVPNFRNGYGGAPRVGFYYRDRGWYHGGRYWGERYRHRNGWRYR